MGNRTNVNLTAWVVMFILIIKAQVHAHAGQKYLHNQLVIKARVGVKIE